MCDEREHARRRLQLRATVMPNKDDLKKYADVAVKVGLGLTTGDRLVILSNTEVLEFTRTLVSSAYEAGAVNVDVIWADDVITRARFESGPEGSAEAITGFGHLLNASVDGGDYLLQVKADNPDLMADLDPKQVAAFQRVNAEFIEPFRRATSSQKKNWAIIAAPSPVWAKAVFPDKSDEAAVDALWEAILRTCRIDQDDPVDAWQDHIRHLAARSAYLNEKSYDRLHYSGPGTDLTVGLPDGHVWVGGQTTSAAGVGFVPNLPTEEVFTSPHRMRAEGIVSSTKPLSLFGSLVEGFSFEMAEGQVVSLSASRGQEILESALDIDEGAVRFGEVALVPQSSAVAVEGLIWQNMLFDENDACHIALGKGFPVAIDGGPDMELEALVDAGINDSAIHVDFVVGSGELDIFGIGGDGSEEAILNKGEWAFEV